MMFKFDTYIVLDVPPPISERVMEVRVRHQDEFRSSLPVEITLAGSSGVGVLVREQDRAEVFGQLQVIARETSPIIAEFGKVLRFEGTDIFVLTIKDESPFQRLHKVILDSGIRFMASPFPYKPHCTLRSRSPVSEKEAADLLGLRIEGAVKLRMLSVYMMSGLPMELLFTTALCVDREAG
ncbi:MAG: 2'-5' RNA ligase family protein [Anaerolineales bacterium]